MAHKKLNPCFFYIAALLVTGLFNGVDISINNNELPAIHATSAAAQTPTPTITPTPTPTPGFEPTPTPTPGVEPTTTVPTTTIKTCMDNDGDGYGDGCAAGSDCNDTEPFYHDICPDCRVVVIPRALGWFLGEEQKNRMLLVIGNKGTIFDENTEVRWEPEAIGVVSKRIFFKRFMLLKVSIDGAAMDKGTYRALIGDCLGELTLVK